MQERVMGFLQSIRDRWNALDKVQKIRIAAAAAVVLIALLLAVFLATRTVYRVAWVDLSHVDAMSMSAMLDEAEIRNRVTAHGPVGHALEVDQNRVSEARFLIETMGVAAERNFSYEDALDFSGIGATETVTRQNMLRAKQNDLEQALLGMDGIIGARVELALPEATRFFVQTADPARAAATVRTTRRLGRAEGEVIARFISRSVLGLDMENIVVMDTDFNMLFSGEEFGEEDSVLSDLLDLMARERVRVTGEVQNIFNRTGFDEVVVVPNLVYSQMMRTAEQVTFGVPIEDMEQGLVLNEQTLRASARGTPGTPFDPGFGAAQQQVIPTYPFMAGGDMQAQQDEAVRTFALDELREVFQDVPSSYIREDSSITVNLLRYRFYRQESLMRQNGGDFTEDDWEDFIRNTHDVLIDDETLMAHYALLVSNATGIPIENVTVSASTVPIFVDYVPTPIALNQIIMFIILAILLGLLAFGLIRRTQPDDDDEIEPELSVEDLLVSTQMEEALDEEMLEPIGFEEGSEAKRKLDEFIEDKPEAAASLLRHWLNEAEA